ncbi:MAG: hypothetical protein GOVbin2669_21 [Prokaryotic dsDNA virus sp.]|nr:MAG: hypothetical protein GOVbin2669_21 [Prokaryotic dsDNA virus sp.]|tara:strand:+ start:2378 stop:2620 length:243 start_codon:yes stop_codon:yes gene_type:complete
MKVKRFTKSSYTTIDKSKLHKFLKEEGFVRSGLALDLDVTVCTIDRYMDNPHKIKVEHIKRICEETGVDANFIFNLIYEN